MRSSRRCLTVLVHPPERVELPGADGRRTAGSTAGCGPSPSNPSPIPTVRPPGTVRRERGRDDDPPRVRRRRRGVRTRASSRLDRDPPRPHPVRLHGERNRPILLEETRRRRRGARVGGDQPVNDEAPSPSAGRTPPASAGTTAPKSWTKSPRNSGSPSSTSRGSTRSEARRRFRPRYPAITLAASPAGTLPFEAVAFARPCPPRWSASHCRYWSGGTTRTVASIFEWPVPQYSAQ